MSEFWHLTPRLVSLVFEAQADRLFGEREERMYAAWLGSVLSRASRLPRWHEIKPQRFRSEPTEQSILTTLRMIVAANGGTDSTIEAGQTHGT